VAFKDRLTSTLSGGERRKVALASVLAGQPQLLLLDEPLAGLDPFSRNEVISHLVELKNKGITLIISTHQFEGAIELMEEMTVMANGSDLVCDTPGEIFSDASVLKATGVKAPLVARIANHLRDMNWPISGEIVSMPDLEISLSSIVLGGE
jgi:energy-coupling factor transport system ATP-binding protein